MKNAMLFFVALMFSISANAATLNLSSLVSVGATQSVDLTGNDVVLGGGTVSTKTQGWSSLFSLTTDSNTMADIEFSFNPVKNLSSATLVFFDLGNAAFNKMFAITGDFSFSSMLSTGSTYLVGILTANSKALKYDVSVSSVSAVPIPAAMLLLAPVLMGFFGLRRKALKATAA